MNHEACTQHALELARSSRWVAWVCCALVSDAAGPGFGTAWDPRTAALPACLPVCLGSTQDWVAYPASIRSLALWPKAILCTSQSRRFYLRKEWLIVVGISNSYWKEKRRINVGHLAQCLTWYMHKKFKVLVSPFSLHTKSGNRGEKGWASSLRWHACISWTSSLSLQAWNVSPLSIELSLQWLSWTHFSVISRVFFLFSIPYTLYKPGFIITT